MACSTNLALVPPEDRSDIVPAGKHPRQVHLAPYLRGHLVDDHIVAQQRRPCVSGLEALLPRLRPLSAPSSFRRRWEGARASGPTPCPTSRLTVNLIGMLRCILPMHFWMSPRHARISLSRPSLALLGKSGVGDDQGPGHADKVGCCHPRSTDSAITGSTIRPAAPMTIRGRACLKARAAPSWYPCSW